MFQISEVDSSADAIGEQVEILIGQRDPQWHPVEPLVTLLEVSNSMHSPHTRTIIVHMVV